MNRWLAPIALVIAILSVVLIWTSSKKSERNISLLDEKLNSLSSQAQENTKQISAINDILDQLTSQTGKLVAAKQSQEQEINILENNPSQLVEVLDKSAKEKGIINIQTRINRVSLRNKSRFNVREIKIRASYLNEHGTETGLTAILVVHDVLVAGESKWMVADDAPWVDGHPGAKLTVINVEVIGK